MSNPVAPPPPANEGGFPPPADQGFGSAPAGQPHPGQQPQGQPYPGHGYPDQAQQGQPYPDQPQQGQPYPGQPQQGQPYPGQAYPGQAQQGQPYPGQPYPGQPQQGFGDAPGAVPAAPKKKSAAGKLLLRIGLAILVAIVGVVVKTTIFGDKARNAAVGDCIAASKDVKANEETQAEAEVVDCTSSKAAFSVVGRVEGVTDTNSKACDSYFKEDEEFFVYSSDAGKGYLLCLKPKA